MSVPAAVLDPPRFEVGPDRERPLSVSDLEWVGCKAVPMTAAEYEAHEGRIECYDSESGVAWMACEGPGPGHEIPRVTLSDIVRDISRSRGSRIRCCGESQMRLFDARSGKCVSIHPDHLVFLSRDLEDPRTLQFFAVGQGPYPEVVFEVDHTTDVRGSRLRLYEKWRFPEVWVEVPDAPSPSRPRGRKSGLEIYLLEGRRFVRSPVSRAFPGFLATEIHRALNEWEQSPETDAALKRVGAAIGAPEGTGPEDDAWLAGFINEGRAEGRVEGRAEGRVEGRAEGRVEGRTEGRVEGRAETVVRVARELLRSRGIELPASFPDDLRPSDRSALRQATPETVVAAAAATSLADFIARLRAPDP